MSKVLKYINDLRRQCGMPELISNDLLSQAASNHSNYLWDNQETGHYETEGNTGFTGVEPADRTEHVGYPSTWVFENVMNYLEGYAKPDWRKGVDNLMSAIYHRFVFLSFYVDEIGWGFSHDSSGVATYNLGLSAIREACNGSGYDGSSSFTYDRCIDQTAIGTAQLEQMFNSIEEESWNEIIWPPRNGIDIPPVFYEEAPDPLPNHSMSGYPISICFRPAYHGEVTVREFKLYDIEIREEEVELIRSMNAGDDPHSHFKDYQFAIFPKYRLKWNSPYRVFIEYESQSLGRLKTTYDFRTRDLKVPTYTVTKETEKIQVSSGNPFAMYIQQTDECQDLSECENGFRYAPAATTLVTDWIDSNTLKVTVTADVGTIVFFDFYNKNETIEIEVVEEGEEGEQQEPLITPYINPHYIYDKERRTTCQWEYYSAKYDTVKDAQDDTRIVKGLRQDSIGFFYPENKDSGPNHGGVFSRNPIKNLNQAYFDVITQAQRDAGYVDYKKFFGGAAESCLLFNFQVRGFDHDVFYEVQAMQEGDFNNVRVGLLAPAPGEDEVYIVRLEPGQTVWEHESTLEDLLNEESNLRHYGAGTLFNDALSGNRLKVKLENASLSPIQAGDELFITQRTDVRDTSKKMETHIVSAVNPHPSFNNVVYVDIESNLENEWYYSSYNPVSVGSLTPIGDIRPQAITIEENALCDDEGCVDTNLVRLSSISTEHEIWRIKIGGYNPFHGTITSETKEARALKLEEEGDTRYRDIIYTWDFNNEVTRVKYTGRGEESGAYFIKSPYLHIPEKAWINYPSIRGEVRLKTIPMAFSWWEKRIIRPGSKASNNQSRKTFAIFET